MVFGTYTYLPDCEVFRWWQNTYFTGNDYLYTDFVCCCHRVCPVIYKKTRNSLMSSSCKYPNSVFDVI